MAAGKVHFKSDAGGITSVSREAGATNGELVLPVSGTVVSVAAAVTDNAIARYDSTTGKLQNSGVIVDDSNKILINDAVNGGAIYLSGKTGTSNDAQFTVRDANRLDIEYNGAKRVSIDNLGNVGIGVTPSSASKLQVKTGTNRNISISDQVTINGAATIEAIDDTRGSNISLELRGTTVSITRPSGTTCIFDSVGNLLLTSGTGALGYGTGAGGTVTQLTSKSTAVTLNKPTGQIIMNNAALAAGATTIFAFNNTMVTFDTTCYMNIVAPFGIGANYRVESYISGHNVVGVKITNTTGGVLSDAIILTYVILKGAIS